MIKIIKPRKRRSYVDSLYAIKARKKYLEMISDATNAISLTFEIGGYGIKISGYHLMWATFVAAYFFLVVCQNTIGFVTDNQFGILIESIVGGFISLCMLSLILGILNVIYNVPKYFVLFKE